MSPFGVGWSRWLDDVVLSVLVITCASVALALILRRRRAPKGPKHAAVEQPMYKRLGMNAIHAAVEQMYGRVLNDPEVASYFARMPPRRFAQLKAHQARLISQLLGGPVVMELEQLRGIHRHLTISNDAYLRVVCHLWGVLCGFEVEPGVMLTADPDIITHLLVSLEQVRPYIVTQDYRFAEIGRGQ